MNQNYQNYSAGDHETWSYLMNRSETYLLRVNREFKKGMKLLDLPKQHIPRFSELNKILIPLTGWKYVAANSSVTIDEFLAALAKKEFLSSVDIRTREELDFCKLPDIFHDVFGHAAMLTNVPFCNFLEGLGKLSLRHSNNEYAIRYLANIYWYTAEVGLVMENNELKYYGGSVISSLSEIERIYSPESKKIPFNLEQVGHTTYDSYAVNDIYYTVNSLAELNSCLGELDKVLTKYTRQPLPETI